MKGWTNKLWKLNYSKLTYANPFKLCLDGNFTLAIPIYTCFLIEIVLFPILTKNRYTIGMTWVKFPSKFILKFFFAGLFSELLDLFYFPKW